MKHYEKPMAVCVTLCGTDVILTSPIVTLTDGGAAAITALTAFKWNS